MTDIMACVLIGWFAFSVGGLMGICVGVLWEQMWTEDNDY